ncbi:MAG: thioredoxin domain-containing protein [Thermodesulfobacteriota bacterium]
MSMGVRCSEFEFARDINHLSALVMLVMCSKGDMRFFSFKMLLTGLLVVGQIVSIGPVSGMDISKIDLGKIPPDGGAKYNRLIFEKSPYLLQHAENPVDWYPWGEEAFARARRENKPIFLSIGYSTCHWCHVMAHESFASLRVAEILNRHFISIKVDREERPDIDGIYMKVAQIISGRGGWPLTVFMTPDRKPFFAGTYFPVESGYGRPGFVDIIESTIELWQSDQERLLGSAEKITGLINETAGKKEAGKLDESILVKAYQQFASIYDSQYGGFGKAPKFPSPHQLMFLLRYWQRTGEEQALEMVKETLTALRKGGIYDQLGWGFHRYSTDREFLVPHFEKMLYDQALLAIAYLETYQATGEDFFADTAREIFSYVLRDMTAPTGGFYSAEDADSEGVEGKFYLWSVAEITNLLGAEDGAEFSKVFGIKKDGNYHDEVTGNQTGLNILHLQETDFPTALEKSRQILFAKRAERIHPFKDDKILTSWNGLMIAALAMGGRVLGESSYLAAAEKAADFIIRELRDDKGRLLRRYRDGEAALPAYLDDYAFLVYGLMNLYEADFNDDYLLLAVELTYDMVNLFWDDEHEVFNFSGSGNEELLGSIRDFYDGAIPAGNSVALLNILKLSKITVEPKFREMSAKMSRKIMVEAGEYPPGYAMFLSAVDYLLGPAGEIVIAGKPDSAATGAVLKLLNRSFAPNKVVVLHQPGPEGLKIEKIAGYTKFQTMVDGQTTVYLCRDYTCEKPIINLDELAKAIKDFPGPANVGSVKK